MNDTGSENFYRRLHAFEWKEEFSFHGPTIRIRRHMMFRELARIPDLKTRRVLDIGCGDYSALRGIRRRWGARHLFGSDIVETAFAEDARRDAIHSRALDIGKETWEDFKFDVILCADVLEHVEDDAAALRNIRRMLAPGGAFLFHVPFSMRLWSAHDESVGHFRRYEAADLVKKLRDAGFDSLAVKTYGFPFMRMYYDMFLARVPPVRTQRRKSAFDRLASFILYALFRLDAFFIDPRCRRGFALIGAATARFVDADSPQK